MPAKPFQDPFTILQLFFTVLAFVLIVFGDRIAAGNALKRKRCHQLVWLLLGMNVLLGFLRTL